MSYTPLQLDAISELLADVGLRINSNAVNFMGTSTGVGNYVQGAITSGTVLDNLTTSMRLAFDLIGTDPDANVSLGVYNNLINILNNYNIIDNTKKINSIYHNHFDNSTYEYIFEFSINEIAYDEYSLYKYTDYKLKSFEIIASPSTTQNISVVASSAAALCAFKMPLTPSTRLALGHLDKSRCQFSSALGSL